MSKHRVIIRDDDTCGLTPVPYLERLYRPFLDRDLPVCLAVIPDVSTTTKVPDGRAEGFVRAGLPAAGRASVPITVHLELLEYLRANNGLQVIHHGHHHDYFEFASRDADSLGERLDEGRRLLEAAGLGAPRTFVAPYDQYSPEALFELQKRFEVFSTGWFDRKRLPMSWWPGYIAKKITKRRHWQAGSLQLLTHPGCLLSYQRDFSTMLDTVQQAVRGGELTVLVTHWWEYFDNNEANEPYIEVLHEVARWLAEDPDVEVIGFEDLIPKETRHASRAESHPDQAEQQLA